MDGCTIDIAEYRCRAITASTPRPNRLPRRPHGLEIVELETAWRQGRQSRLFHGAVVEEDPRVYDIGAARDAQHWRHLGGMNPERNAKVLHFRNQLPAAARVEEGRGAEPRTVKTDGPLDPPPAA